MLDSQGPGMHSKQPVCSTLCAARCRNAVCGGHDLRSGTGSYANATAEPSAERSRWQGTGRLQHGSSLAVRSAQCDAAVR
eukprot:6175064-Pleurochrysis_carterae.AAC.1